MNRKSIVHCVQLFSIILPLNSQFVVIMHPSILLLLLLSLSLAPSRAEEGEGVNDNGDNGVGDGSSDGDGNGKDPDFDRTIPQLIESRNFVSEEHFVTTKDGYILTVYRIVNPKITAAGSVGRPVILQHGLMSSGHDFIINSPGGDLEEDHGEIVGNNLGFELSRRGYDVWLANSRGNTYARNHTFLHPDMGKAFWDFTFDQMIEHDLPSTIDYVLSVNGRKTVAYVGHSQGTLIMFGLLSQQAKYNDIVKPFIALAPVTTVGNAATPLKHLARIPFINNLLERIGGAFLPNGSLIKTIADKLCNSNIKGICSNIMFMVNGFSEAQLNQSRIAVYASHAPAGTSTKNIAHFGQLVKCGKFAKYDFGSSKNKDVYGSQVAPEYPLQNIRSSDIALLSSDNDWLASPADVNLLVRKLNGKLIEDYKIPIKGWNHLDFLIGRDAGVVVNRKILHILRPYDDRE